MSLSDGGAKTLSGIGECMLPGGESIRFGSGEGKSGEAVMPRDGFACWTSNQSGFRLRALQSMGQRIAGLFLGLIVSKGRNAGCAEAEGAARQQGSSFLRENSSNGGKAIRTFWLHTRGVGAGCQE